MTKLNEAYGCKAFDKMVGLTVVELLREGTRSLYFRMADGSIYLFMAEGGCCSVSYWNDLYNVDALIGGTVVSGESVQLADATKIEKNPDYQDTRVQAYCIRIKTDKGSSDLIFRNSSNGFYDGDCRIDRVVCVRPGSVAVTEDWSQ